MSGSLTVSPADTDALLAGAHTTQADLRGEEAISLMAAVRGSQPIPAHEQCDVSLMPI